MKVVWHKHLLMRSWSIKNCWNRITKTACLLPQTPADVAAIVWFSLNVHKCIRNAVSVSLFLMCFQIVCWKLWFIIASLVYSLVFCGAVGLNVVACLGRIKLLGALTSACGPVGNRSSHLRTDTQTYIQRGKSAWTSHFEGDRLLSASPAKVAGCLPGGSSQISTTISVFSSHILKIEHKQKNNVIIRV